MENNNMVRVNTRISKQANEWLDAQSQFSGVPKSTLILLAIENYIREREAMNKLDSMSQLINKLDSIEDKLSKVMQAE